MERRSIVTQQAVDAGTLSESVGLKIPRCRDTFPRKATATTMPVPDGGGRVSTITVNWALSPFRTSRVDRLLPDQCCKCRIHREGPWPRLVKWQGAAQLAARSRLGRCCSGISGVLTDLPMAVGQQVTPGTMLAKVVVKNQLKAALNIPETQARDIQTGQPAAIDTHNGIIEGTVQRIDPGVHNGTVTVDVALNGFVEGERPDLSVDGQIDLQRLTDVLYVGRPAFGNEDSTISLFKLSPDGKYANRAPVKVGRASVNAIQVLSGLKEGDTVILSDMSRWDQVDRIRLE